MIAEIRIDMVCVRHATDQAVDLRTRVQLLQAPGRGQAALAQNDEGGSVHAHQPCHRSPGTMISEKYGEDMGSTASSGTTF
jgi:hypothetical protein